jgi:hypothetical protein
VGAGLNQLAQATGADELIVVCDVFDTALRLRSLDIAAQSVGLAGTDSAGASSANQRQTLAHAELV